MQNKGIFITLEGCEGVGKSTALTFIADFLKAKKINGVITREPGGTPIGEDVRRVLLNDTNKAMTAETELLLLFAARSQHITQVITPALQAGRWVVSDRFTDASFAYQGGGRQMPVNFINDLAVKVQKNVRPNLTILLDAPVEVGMSRLKNRGKKDRIEQEDIDFFERVRAAYLSRATAEPNRFLVVDASQSIEMVQTEITAALLKLLDQ